MLLITCFIFGLLGSLTWAAPKGRSVCPSGTFANKDGSQWYCYKFFEDKLSFQHAEEECQFKWKGNLATITSDKEGRTIGAYVTKENIEGNYVWIGLQRSEGSSISVGWRWVDGSRSTYRKWSRGEPNNVSSNEYCVALYPSSGHVNWLDLACNSRFPFLCKWTPS